MARRDLLWLGWLGLLLMAVPGEGNSTHAQEETRFDHERAWHLQRTGEILSLEEILRHPRLQREGRIIEVELEEKHDRVVYEVEMADTVGKVWEMRFDAKDGRLLSEEEED